MPVWCTGIHRVVIAMFCMAAVRFSLGFVCVCLHIVCGVPVYVCVYICGVLIGGGGTTFFRKDYYSYIKHHCESSGWQMQWSSV